MSQEIVEYTRVLPGGSVSIIHPLLPSGARVEVRVQVVEANTPPAPSASTSDELPLPTWKEPFTPLPAKATEFSDAILEERATYG